MDKSSRAAILHNKPLPLGNRGSFHPPPQLPSSNQPPLPGTHHPLTLPYHKRHITDRRPYTPLSSPITSSSPSTHRNPSPRCRCRILPTQLFLVNRQTRHEALDVLYGGGGGGLPLLELHDNDLAATLAFLRDALPRDGLARLRRLRFIMTEAQCAGWTAGPGGVGIDHGPIACGYPPAMLERQVARPCWGGGPPPALDYAGGWRAVVALLAARADVPRLRLEVDMRECAWTFVEDTVTWEDNIKFNDGDDDEQEENGGGNDAEAVVAAEPPAVDMFRFIYDFAMDVTAGMCALRGLGGVSIELSAFQQLKPWLEREVLGRERELSFETELDRRTWEDLWARPRFYQVVPPWHDMDQRLEGSNNQPDE